ncbi:sugar phosphate nucleotidyltransferase [Alkalihalobacillus hemicellulosilyticus]|uniref:Glucose-1-phosphate thymidylyltransferase n=1 Tax=Halalkalibacter hemicellulosilyticusJCM 9152 TaxID=1236971 RepID=W4QG95_9BACI|nr:sugar phosphate nucleotidyltransferase [Halalkalibacter hemicellulosilyticus]GAE30922.1 glucose-1-phosphate thymidylyltransferase [Halalkalibacter hemicellulosilyticusJCM 9152]
MKGVILAGGTGSRLRPFTTIMNKHLLPVGAKPMIYWSIFKLREAGIHDILIITNRESLTYFIQLFDDGQELDVKLTYKIQKEASGIADAISLAKGFVEDESFIVMLGDNLLEDSLSPFIQKYKEKKEGAMVLLKEVHDPERFGIAEIDNEKKEVLSIIEKPSNPKTNYCVVGIYMYDQQVFQFIDQLIPSERGELEVTDINRFYIKNKQLTYEELKGWWLDAGTHYSLHEANVRMYQRSRKRKDK